MGKPKEPKHKFEDEANEPPPVPFDDALRHILKAKPQHKPAPKPAVFSPSSLLP